VEVSDLYAQNFMPAAGPADFTSLSDASHFHYQAEQLSAAMHEGFSEDLKREQDRLLRADLLILQFPLWWGGPPAILKGWFDRTCAYGVAYVDGRRFETGLFNGRRSIVSVTTGGSPQRFSTSGGYGLIDKVLWPVEQLFLRYLGYEVLEPYVCYATHRVEAETRRDYLRLWKKRLTEILDAKTPEVKLEELSSSLGVCRA
jgi:NAD(P)H dehydrogenase (quinone)